MSGLSAAPPVGLKLAYRVRHAGTSRRQRQLKLCGPAPASTISSNLAAGITASREHIRSPPLTATPSPCAQEIIGSCCPGELAAPENLWPTCRRPWVYTRRVGDKAFLLTCHRHNSEPLDALRPTAMKSRWPRFVTFQSPSVCPHRATVSLSTIAEPKLMSEALLPSCSGYRGMW